MDVNWASHESRGCRSHYVFCLKPPVKVMRIYVWNVLVKAQGWDWFCITQSEKSAELLGAVVTAAPQNRHWHLCCAHPQQLHRCKGWQLEAVGWWAWGEPEDCSVLARKDSQQLWHRNEHLGVCQSAEGAQGPISRGVQGWDEGCMHRSPRDCPASASLPHLTAYHRRFHQLYATLGE